MRRLRGALVRCLRKFGMAGNRSYIIKAVVCHLFATVWECPRHVTDTGEWTGHTRGGYMTRILTETLLFSCQAAFVTGIVIAAASLII